MLSGDALFTAEFHTLAYTIGIDARKLQDFGIGTYVRNLVAHLGEIDPVNRYVLFTGPQRKDNLRDLPENFRLVTESSPVYSVRELLALSWKLFRLDLDLYHATHYVLPAVSPCRVVVTIHDIIHLLYPEYLPNRLAFFYAQRMIRRSLARSDRVITVSKNTKSDLGRYFDLDTKKVKVIYNGVEDAFRHESEIPDLDRWLERLDLQRPYILFVGNPKPHKNLDNVLRAYARARQLQEIEAPLVFVGDRGNAEVRLRSLASSLGVENQVKMLGHVAQEALPAVYRAATLFLYPTLYEGFGLPVIEAMASGVAVITSDNSALKEIAEGYAHLVNPMDVEGMARAIAHCISDTEHRTALAKLGLRRAADFSWRRTAEQTLETYLTAIRSRDRSLGATS